MITGYTHEQLITDSRRNATPECDRERVEYILNDPIMRNHALWVFADMMGFSPAEPLEKAEILDNLFSHAPTLPKEYIVSETGRILGDLIVSSFAHSPHSNRT
jgi:hypothetical protein